MPLFTIKIDALVMKFDPTLSKQADRALDLFEGKLRKELEANYQAKLAEMTSQLAGPVSTLEELSKTPSGE